MDMFGRDFLKPFSNKSVMIHEILNVCINALVFKIKKLALQETAVGGCVGWSVGTYTFKYNGGNAKPNTP